MSAQTPPITRADFLRRAASGAALSVVPLPLLLDRRRSTTQPRIAIVGAGLAGLTCAHRLAQRGVPATLTEAHDSRVGGRCWTARGFADGQTAEHGGEFIDTAHRRIRVLAAELGLRLDDVLAIARREYPDATTRYVFDGARRTARQALGDTGLLQRQANADLTRVGPMTWRNTSRVARQLDEMTAADWLERTAPGPAHALLRAATRQYMAEEYGLDCARLSALTMLQAWGRGGTWDTSDERFHVHGGNDQIAHRLQARLPAGTLRMGQALTRLRHTGRRYALSLTGRRAELEADVVVLCLPFPALRRVDVSAAGFSARRRRCIDELGMGTNSKLLLSFKRPLHTYDQFDGQYYDEDVDTWDSAVGQSRRAGLLTMFSGGRYGAGYRAPAHGPAPREIVARELTRLRQGVPGISAGFDGQAWLDHWTRDPWTHGSYSAFLPGQVTRYSGFIGLPEGNVHFGGEHTSVAAQGYLEGAVQSGERCASEVLRAIGQ
jgi:monoamine oxidase